MRTVNTGDKTKNNFGKSLFKGKSFFFFGGRGGLVYGNMIPRMIK